MPCLNYRSIKTNYQASTAVLILTGIVLLGLSKLILDAFIRKHSIQLIFITAITAGFIWIAFHYGEFFAQTIFSDDLPIATALNWMQIIAATLILSGFVAAVFFQSITPLLQKNENFIRFSVHLKNGFYTNTVFDKLVGALNSTKN